VAGWLVIARPAHQDHAGVCRPIGTQPDSSRNKCATVRVPTLWQRCARWCIHRQLAGILWTRRWR